MAKALCELQLELQCNSPSMLVADSGSMNSMSPEAFTEHFIPKTPVGKESGRKLGVHKVSTNLTNELAETKSEVEVDEKFGIEHLGTMKSLQTHKLSPNSCPSIIDDLNEICKAGPHSPYHIQFDGGRKPYSLCRIGNFPSPRELANLDESFLAKRCSLGYRASHILKLAQSIVKGRIQPRQLEKVCNVASLASYDKLAKQLKQIDGFGPFTCANVLMCMGFYHVIPTDSETIRHLKQVHARKSTIQTVQRDVEKIYGKYAPFQFLAYWSEMWQFYEKRFGKLSEMPPSDYKLITASNMRVKDKNKNKRARISCHGLQKDLNAPSILNDTHE